MPMTVVPMQPIRSRPGTNQPATAPAMRPITIQRNGIQAFGHGPESYDAAGSIGAVKSASTAPLRTAVTGKADQRRPIGLEREALEGPRGVVGSPAADLRLISSAQSLTGLQAPTTE